MWILLDIAPEIVLVNMENSINFLVLLVYLTVPQTVKYVLKIQEYVLNAMIQIWYYQIIANVVICIMMMEITSVNPVILVVPHAILQENVLGVLV